MNSSKSKELLNLHSPYHKKLLQFGALGRIVSGNAVRILDAENLKNGKFIRCEVGSLKPTGWGLDIKWVDIPEINLQKAIKYGSSGTHTRPIVSNGAWIGDSHTVRIKEYNPETHEIHVVGQHSGEFILKVPVTFSTYANTEGYYYDLSPLRANPTEPHTNNEVLLQVQEFLERTK